MTRDRLLDWDIFQGRVYDHIRDYTIPQYSNDSGDEQIDLMSAEECISQIKRYCARFGKNARGYEEAKRDLLKIAHYAQFAYDKFEFSHRRYEEGQGHD